MSLIAYTNHPLAEAEPARFDAVAWWRKTTGSLPTAPVPDPSISQTVVDTYARLHREAKTAGAALAQLRGEVRRRSEDGEDDLAGVEAVAGRVSRGRVAVVASMAVAVAIGATAIPVLWAAGGPALLAMPGLAGLAAACACDAGRRAHVVATRRAEAWKDAGLAAALALQMAVALVSIALIAEDLRPALAVAAVSAAGLVAGWTSTSGHPARDAALGADARLLADLAQAERRFADALESLRRAHASDLLDLETRDA